MSAKAQVAMGICATIVLVVLDELIPDGGSILLIVVGGLAAVSAIGA